MSEDRTDAEEEFELDLSILDADELVEFEARLVEEYQGKRSAATAEFSAEEAADHRAELRGLVDVIKAVREEMSQRAEDAENDRLVAELAGESFAAAVAPPQEDEEAEEEAPEEEEPEAEEADEEAAAEVQEEATPAIKISPKGLKSDVKAGPAPSPITASADVPGFPAGATLPDFNAVARALMAKRPAVRGTDKGYDGSRFLVASIAGDYPAERTLSNDLDANMKRIEAVTAPTALAASGGLCAPIEPYYTLTVLGDACRPVRDSLAVFKADRGGIRYLPAPELADLAGSTRRTTAAEDAAGYTNQDPAGTTAPKPCLHVTCESEQTCVIAAFSRCLTFGNMGARTYPEQVEAWVKLGLAEFARYSEVGLIDAIKAGSTALTAAQVYGATFSILEQVSAIVTSFRGRYRLCSNHSLRAIFPWWAKEVIRADIAAQSPGDGLARYNVSDAQINEWFSVRGINITWRQDDPTGFAHGGIFTQPVSAGAIELWPATIEWAVFPEGNWLYLDGGSLDLGLVRDSTLNSTNDYQIFYEEFNGLCNINGRSLWVTSTLTANGSTAPLAEALRTY